MAGYSGTPLDRKLGLREGLRLFVDVDPAARDLVDLEALGLGGWAATTRLPRSFDVGLLFCRSTARMRRRLVPVLQRAETAGSLWVCWPKRASGLPTDLDGNVVREVGLASGVVDVKVAAIDEVWSGLKFVRRVADR